uniref:transcription cofactor vestigial-like protein 4 isoform X1 n=1 Tax=Myxine glutinosa TaxID=7769 RepID=UPI00358E7500
METPLHLLSRAASLVNGDMHGVTMGGGLHNGLGIVRSHNITTNDVPLALTTSGKVMTLLPDTAPMTTIAQPPLCLPPSPGKRKFVSVTGDVPQYSTDSEEEENPVSKACRLMPLNLSKSASVDYISERDTIQGHNLLVRSASLPPRHPAGLAYRVSATASSLSPALATSPNASAACPSEAARSSPAFLHNASDGSILVPPFLSSSIPAVLLQQMRPSVITCAPGASFRGSRQAAKLMGFTANGLSNRRDSSGSTDPVVEEHFRRSLGPGYRETEPVLQPQAHSVSVTGSVDEHFRRALGETWLQLRSSPPGNPTYAIHECGVMAPPPCHPERAGSPTLLS